MHTLNWDDLRFVLAVAETGSVNAAARALNVNHATVLRRIAAFEEVCGGPVFERDKSGYRLRPDRAQVIEEARIAAQHVRAAETLMRGVQSDPGSTIRLTSTDTFCQTVLPQIISPLTRRILPDRLTILCSNAHLDLARLRADLALRPAVSLPDELIGRQVATMRFDVFSRDGAEAPWLGLTGALAGSLPAKWMADRVRPDQIVASADSFCVMAELALQGVGQALMPSVLGVAHPDLQRHSDLAIDIEVPVWIACHRDLAGSDKLRRVMDAIEKQMDQLRPALMGDA